MMKDYAFAIVLSSMMLISGSAMAGTMCVVQSSATQTCREFNMKISYDGTYPQQDGGQGVACLQSDGFWTIVSGPGFGSSFVRNDNQVIAYPGQALTVDGQLIAQPVKVRYIVTKKSACVPSMPRFYAYPYPIQAPYR